jgi:hypothetical protein
VFDLEDKCISGSLRMIYELGHFDSALNQTQDGKIMFLKFLPEPFCDEFFVFPQL